jgi:uncharacterized protein (DUF362 family)
MKEYNEHFESFLNKKISRRDFIKLCLAGLATAALHKNYVRPAIAAQSSTGRKKSGAKGQCDLAVVKGEDPYMMTVKAVEALGGMGKFVKKGAVVVVKPNIGWDRNPEQAANTNPFVVAALVDLCLKAGAKRVNVFDVTCNDARRCYENSGIKKAAEKQGAKVYYPDDWNSVSAKFSYKSPMQDWPIIRDAVDCDTFINVPVLKHHGLTGLTLSMKNLMGVCGGDRGKMHRDIGTCLVDLTDFINPDLTVIDGYRFLTKHGPTGGDLKDVDTIKTVIAGTDPTLADAFAAELVSKDPKSVPNIEVAMKRNFGSADTAGAKISRVTL